MNKKIVKSFSIITIVSIISKLVAFYRDIITSSAFGANYQTDAYNMALNIPIIIFAVLGQAISTTFIPALSKSCKENGKEDMFQLANSMMNILMIVSILLYCFSIYFTPQIVHIVAPKFIGTTYELTVKLTKLSLVVILFMSMTSGYIAILQVLDDFFTPTLISVVLNLPVIIYILFFKNHNIIGLMYSTIVGYAFQLLIQIPSLKKNKYKYKIKINWNDGRIKKLFMLIVPVLIGISVNEVNYLIDRIMASGLIEGSISALNIANKLNGMAYGIFVTPMITILYPFFSKIGCDENRDKLKAYISKSINIFNLVLIPSSAILLILRFEIIRVIFKHGMFDEKAVQLTSTALLYLCIHIPFYGVRDICNRVFYALQDTKTSMINGIIGTIINIVANLILVNYMGIAGLALATSISAIATSILLIVSLRKKIGGINGKKILKSGIKICAATLCMIFVVFMLNKIIFIRFVTFKSQLIGLIILIIIGGIVYIAMIVLLKIPEVYEAIKFIKKRFPNLRIR